MSLRISDFFYKLSVTGSRGNGFGPLLSPVVVAFEAFPLLDEVVANV